ncbi:MAG TPA: bifunctional helix-turn-helix domain-containing protein/methylated-DNA--[protein]-cysteine S-methyltransferase [Burkholderiales bacterium]|nr:bifunctional helix-turn-helix domain-containing protein/methylated-DNA--[protein]-cysteine S-methyltransferase [Burkholderiales bacterium]
MKMNTPFAAECDAYRTVEQAIEYLQDNAREQPRLADVAARVGLSEFHFQRRFSEWAGISPKRFLQYLTKEYAKEALRNHEDVLGAAYAAGLSSPGRLHDLLVTCEAVSPGEQRSRGEGVAIRYGFHATPFGPCLLATTVRGICRLAFVGPDGNEAEVEKLRRNWPRAQLAHDQDATEELVSSIFDPTNRGKPLHLWVRGSNFQIKVWEALLRIAPGQLASYEHVARAVDRPRASRAVGAAVGANPVAVLIPCHRVIRKAGDFGDYRWGLARKRALVGREAAARDATAGLTLSAA